MLQRALRLVGDGDHVDGDVARRGVVLEAVEHAPAVHVGQADVEGDRVRLHLAGEGEAVGTAGGDERLEPLVVGEVHQEAAEGRVVLDDQDHAVPRVDEGAIVADLARPRRRLDRRRPRGQLDARPRGLPLRLQALFAAQLRARRLHARQARGHIGEGQIEREGAALAAGAHEPDLAAEQPGQLAADREPEPGASVLAAGSALRLLERLEDDGLLLALDADAGVGHGHAHHGPGGAQDGMIGAPARGRRAQLEGDRPLLGELERVGQEVLEDLL